MNHKQEWTQFKRVGTQAPRSYYIPFDENQPFSFCNKITDRKASNRFVSLNGVWSIKEHDSIENVEINENLYKKIPVPSCVQMHGYDQIQYINCRYPFPCRYHYRACKVT